MRVQHFVADVARHFQIRGDLIGLAPYGDGHINDTYEIRYDQDGIVVRYILQRLNPDIFSDAVGLMDNVARITSHIRTKLEQAGVEDISRRVLALVHTLGGQLHYRDAERCCWRAYPFVERTVTYEVLRSPRQAAELAGTYGHFQEMLLDLPGPPLVEVIAGFHNARQRLETLQRAIEADVCNRAADVRPEIDFALRRVNMVDVLSDAHARAEIPERITHNDTKINNVLFDQQTGEGLCVIDLDTVMPGLTVFDFGDMVRSAASTAREDEQDLSKMYLNRANFEALAQGYWRATRSFLTAGEKDYLAFAGKLISFITGMRFLTDHISGDTYYKTHRSGQNLDRCRTQFKLVECLETQEEELARFVEQLQ